MNVKKCPSSIRHWDSNSQPCDYESPFLTTRPGLLSKAYLNLLGRKQFGQNWMVLVVQFKAELVELLPETL